MKRLRLIVLVALCLLLIAVIIAGLIGTDPKAPRFVPVKSQPTGPFRAMYYDWGDWAPVRDGKMWFWTVPMATNGHMQHFLYDFNKRRVVGELLNAVPRFANGDQTKLLCDGFSGSATLKWKIYRWLEKFPIGRGISQRMNLEEPIWILDLRNNSAVRIGAISVPAGSGIDFVASPGIRFGYDRISGWNGGEHVLCDLKSQQLRRIKIAGTPLGWWDEQNMLIQDSHTDLNLLNVSTGATNTLLTQATISNFLQRMNLPNDAAFIAAFCHWNGREYDVLFTNGTGARVPFLLKLERVDLSLKVLHREFRLNGREHMDNDCTHVVYDGEGPQPGKSGNGGVYLKSLTNNTTGTLVEPDNGGQYSLARFYDGGVIYWRKKHLWRIDLDGSNNAPLIPG